MISIMVNTEVMILLCSNKLSLAANYSISYEEIKVLPLAVIVIVSEK